MLSPFFQCFEMAYFYKNIIRTRKYPYLQIIKCASSTKCLSKSVLSSFFNHNKSVKNYNSQLLKTNEKLLRSNKLYSTKIEDDDCEELNLPENEELSLTDSLNKNVAVRESLYPDSKDPIILNLKQCCTIQEVTDVIYKEKNNIDHTHLCQAVLSLSNLQTAYQENYLENLGKNDIEISPEKMLQNYIDQQISHKGFQDFMSLFNIFYKDLNISELVNCTFHLKKIGLCYGNSEFVLLLNTVVNKLIDDPFQFDLKLLMKYTASIKSDSSLLFGYNAKHSLPALVSYLENCKSEEEFKEITICLINIHLLISPSLLNLYKDQSVKLVNSGIITSENYKTIAIVLRFLNLSHWYKNCKEESDVYCLLAEPSIDKMDISDIIILHKVFRKNLEPATILPKLQNKIHSLLEEIKYDDRLKTYLKLPDLLLCEVYSSWIVNRALFKGIISDLMKKSFPSTLLSLYNSLRFLKIFDDKSCDLFWEKITDENILNCNHENEILELCLKYMYFNNNLGGTYRNVYFEEKAIGTLFKLRENGLLDIIPWKFVRVLSFFIAYGLTSPEKTWKHENAVEMIQKLKNINELSIGEIFILSRGLNIYLKFIKTHDKLEVFKNSSLGILDQILNEHSYKRINEDLKIVEINSICKSFIYRNSNYDCDLFDSILNKYNTSKREEMSSFLIKQAVYNFSITNTIALTFIDQATDYIISKNMNMSGDVLHKFMFLIYQAGYHPNSHEIFEITNNVIDRDKETLSGLSLLNACQALSFYGHISEKLVNYVFSLEFMERLDNEMENCYSKNSYPKRLREQLMSLNRAVCLEYPGLGIPWFHQKYIEEIFSLAPLYKTTFSEDVLHYLYNVLEDRNLVSRSHNTPYGYIVDFCIQMDKNKSTRLLKNREKVAVILLRNNSFMKVYHENGSKELVKVGFAQLKKRHLELLGYHVIEIPHAFWNSMHMSEPDAKFNFIKKNLSNII